MLSALSQGLNRAFGIKVPQSQDSAAQKNSDPKHTVRAPRGLFVVNSGMLLTCQLSHLTRSKLSCVSLAEDQAEGD